MTANTILRSTLHLAAATCSSGVDVVRHLTTGGEWVGGTAQAQMNSVSMKLGETLGMVKAVGTLEKSTELMTMVNELVKVRRKTGLVRPTRKLREHPHVSGPGCWPSRVTQVPEVAATMRNLSKEMMKAGMIEEMVADTLEDVLDEDGMEEETEAEVDKVLSEIAGETLANLPGTDAGSYKVEQADAARQAAAAQAEADNLDMAALHERLNSVRM